MSTFNILRNAVIRNAMTCRHDTNQGYFVAWDEDENFKLYEEFSGLTTRLVWDRNYFAVATSGICYVGPATDQAAFDASLYDQVRVTYRVEVGFNQISPTTGKIQFQTSAEPDYDTEKEVEFTINPDNAYNEYLIDMSQVSEWQGNIIRLRLFPFIDGGIGNILHLKSISVQSSSNFACDSNFNTPTCSKFSAYSHPCPWTGAGGQCSAAGVADGITIAEGVNDKLVVNINGYGEQAVVLRPVRGARLGDIARDVEERLSNVGIGGYSGNRVGVQVDRLVIIADDTREEASTVVVTDTPAARTLGFFDSDGNATFVGTAGVEAASSYEPAGSIQLSRGEIAHFYLPDPVNNQSFVSLDPRNYSVQAGRADYDLPESDVQLDFVGDTVVEFNHPITNNGVVTRVVYAGDARTDTKFIFLHPKADGSLEQYASIPLALGAFGEKVFEKDVEVRVRKGDFVGIYDGKLNLGRSEQRPNVSYFRYEGETFDGDVLDRVDISGNGDQGLYLFAHGQDLQTSAVLDIEFEQPQLLEEIRVVAQEEARTEEVKLSRARAGGVNGGPFITGATGVDSTLSQAPAWADLGALTDGVKEPLPDALNAHPSWLDSYFSPADLYGQTELTLDLDFAKGVPVLFNINRVSLFFVSPNNIKYFRLDYPITTNAADTDRNWGPVTGRYNTVHLDGQLLEPDDHPIYENPIAPTSADFVDSYQVLEYRHLDFAFDSVRARSLRYNVKNYAFEDDETKSTLSNFTLAPSPRILEFEAYAESTPVANISDNFFFESSAEGEEFFLHSTVRDEGSTSARYLIGYPVKFLRAHLVPQGHLKVFSFETLLSRSQTKVTTNTPDLFVNMNISQDDFYSSESIVVSNNGSEVFNYFVDISPQKNPVERCILWNKLGTSDEVAKSELGPSPSVSKRASYPLREFNYAYGAPGYVSDPFWMINKPVTAYISYDDGATWESRGSTISDYNSETYIDSVSPLVGDFLFVTLLLDLGHVYGLETVQQKVSSGYASWIGPSYSSSNTDNPADLNIFDDFVGTLVNARWLRFRAFARSATDAASAIARMTYVQASLNPLDATRNKDEILWRSAPELTNFEFGLLYGGSCAAGWQCREPGFNQYYVVDLESKYNITNLFTGPLLGDGFSTTGDIDFTGPGGVGSRYSSSSRTNANVAYSSSDTSDPNKVVWGKLNGDPGDRSRWVMVRSAGGNVDEVGVHVDDNVAANKQSFPIARWWTADLGTVYADRFNYQEGTHSIAIDYASNQGPAEEEIELIQSFSIDHLMAKRDQLRIFLYISDIDQLDITQGHIALGKNTDEDNGGNRCLEGATPDRDNYFQWNISEMYDTGLLASGWNELYLPFTDNFRVGFPYFARDDQVNQSPTDTSGRNRMRWLRLNFVGKEGNAPFTMNLDDPEIVRGDFLPSKFGTGMYLAGEEYAKFPLNNVNVLEGTIEFYITADWTKSMGCHACEDPRDHTIFRLFNSDQFMISMLMTGDGMRLNFTDNDKQYSVIDNNSPLSIFIDVPTHLALTWDFLGQRSDKAVAFWVNGQLSSAFAVSTLESDNWTPNPSAVLIFGAKAWEGLTTPTTSGPDAIIDNLKVYNYAKTDFSHSLENETLEHIRPSDELISLSSDGVNYYGSETRGTELPLLYRDIPPGGSFTVHVRNKEVEGEIAKEGQSRTSYVEILKARSDAV